MATFAGRFDGQVLLATGAASGIARAVAERYTAEGGKVAIVDLSEDAAKEAAATIPGAIGIGADVSDEQAVAAAVTTAAGHFGRIDGVLNAAGHVVFAPIEEYSYATWSKVLEVHAGGTFLMTKYALPELRKAGGGSIVNIASTAALVAQTNNYAYGAAKSAIIGFTHQIALDLAPDNIRVNVVAPGRTRSGMTTPLYTQRGGGSYEEGAKLSAEHNMQHRVAEPEEQAAAILFLLSSDASFITATTLVVDGGESKVG
jgi:NAD(P)-dependent dehydrogenase (short-subunit alcohol dehydrogenase family)